MNYGSSVVASLIRPDVTALQPGKRPEAILIADDNEDHRSLCADLLEASGYLPLCADNGRAALKIIQERPVDLALLDVQMPDVDGYSICRAMKDNPDTRLIPVVLVTGLSSANDRVDAFESGADGYLSKPVMRPELLARVRSLIDRKHFTDQMERAEKVVVSLVRCIEAKNPYTAGHSERVAGNARALAKFIGLPREQYELVYRGAIVHDVGKVAVPDDILTKPGRLTADEIKVMEQHPAFGERICSPLDSFAPLLSIIRHHHEHLDGTGYPDGLAGSQILEATRIVSIADVYDALTSDRPYRRPLSPEDAIAQMRVEVTKGWWDGYLLDEFVGMMFQPLDQRAATEHRSESPSIQ